MRKNIKELQAGEVIQGIFLLKRKELGKTKDNKPYLKLEFADRTGTIEGRLWDGAEAVCGGIDTGAAVLVLGTVDVWRNNMQIKVDTITYAERESYEYSDLIRSVEDSDGLFEKIKSLLRKNVSNDSNARLVQVFLEDPDFIDAFKNAPGARSWHNAYIGGLLEHTYEVMVIGQTMCDLYPEANRDLVLLGAFLHDIGKIYELDPHTFEYTKAGGLVGHLSIGFKLLHDKINSIDAFPEELRLYLEHIILSHHGEYEQQSPVLPKTLEAIIVYHADELVSQANAVKEIIHAQGGGEREWSNFVTIKNRKFYIKHAE